MTTYAPSNADYQTTRQRRGDRRYRPPDGVCIALFENPPEPEYTLHPDTAPAAIAAAQRKAVRAVYCSVRTRAGGEPPTAAALADAADLPVWVAARRLAEAGLRVAAPVAAPPGPTRKEATAAEKKYYAPVAAKLAAHLRAVGPRTAAQMGVELRLSAATVCRALNFFESLFRLHGYARTGKRPARVWAAAKEVGT